MWLSRIRLLVATFWVGSLWAIGYVAAPTLFATLADRVLAGTIAGNLFRIEAWITIGSSLILLLMLAKEKEITKLVYPVIIAMLVCTLVGYFGVQPFMNALRESAGSNGVMASGSRVQFAWLHGISSAIYLLQSILGAILVVKLKR